MNGRDRESTFHLDQLVHEFHIVHGQSFYFGNVVSSSVDYTFSFSASNDEIMFRHP
jgi:hypothetical protein